MVNNIIIKKEKENESEKEREKKRERDREREREKKQVREIEREREREREKDKRRERERERERETERLNMAGYNQSGSLGGSSLAKPVFTTSAHFGISKRPCRFKCCAKAEMNSSASTSASA